MQTRVTRNGHYYIKTEDGTVVHVSTSDGYYINTLNWDPFGEARLTESKPCGLSEALDALQEAIEGTKIEELLSANA